MKFLNKTMNKTGFLVLFFGLSCLGGCEQISSLVGSFTKKDANKSADVTVTAPIAPSVPLPAEVSISEELPKDVIARVGTWTITVDEFNDRLEKLKEILPEFDPSNLNSKKLILEELVRQELLVMDAEQSGLAQRKDIVDTIGDFRKTLLVQELATGLTKDIRATDIDAQEYYDKNKTKKEFLVKPEWKLREIIVPDESQANNVLVQLLQGADFAELAKTNSKGTTAEKGGDTGYISKFPFEQMQSAATALEIGKISSVFKGPGGYYIVKLESKKGGEPKSFASIKNDLVKELSLRKQQEVVLEYLNQLAAKASIKVNEELLK